MDDATKQQVPGRTNGTVLQTSSVCYSETSRLKGGGSRQSPEIKASPLICIPAGILLVQSFESGLPIVLSLRFLAFTNPTYLA